MDPADPLIERELEKCSTEAQVVICAAGGIGKFLHQSLQFAVVDGYICLAGDAGKARQLARSRRQALIQKQQPQIKLNPPPSAVVSANTILPTVQTSAKTSKSYAGMDLFSRVLPGLSQEAVTERSASPQFLSQPLSTNRLPHSNTNTSSVIRTAVLASNNYSDEAIRKLNGNNTHDSWVTISKASHSVRTLDIGSKSGAIGELDDFSEPFASDVSRLTVNGVTAKDEALKSHAYFEQFKNVLGTSECDSVDKSSDEESAESLVSTDSEAGEEEDGRKGSEMVSEPADVAGLSAVGDLDIFDSEVAETCSPQQLLPPTSLSVSAPEFVPFSFAASHPNLATNLGSSSPKPTSSSPASASSRPSSRSAVTSNKRVQTDNGWAGEMKQLRESHALQIAGLQQQLTDAATQLLVGDDLIPAELII